MPSSDDRSNMSWSYIVFMWLIHIQNWNLAGSAIFGTFLSVKTILVPQMRCQNEKCSTSALTLENKSSLWSFCWWGRAYKLNIVQGCLLVYISSLLSWVWSITQNLDRLMLWGCVDDELFMRVSFHTIAFLEGSHQFAKNCYSRPLLIWHSVSDDILHINCQINK